MEIAYIKKILEVKKLKSELEKKLNISIKISGNNLIYEGDSLDEYIASLVFDAINFGFSVRKSLLLCDEGMMFRVIHIKEHTKRNLKDVKARLIGTKGKTKKTISEISGCHVLIKESEVGIIGSAEDIDNAVTALINIIRGSKQANMYRFLERMNREKKAHDAGI